MLGTHAYWDYHLHNLLLNGISKAGESPFYADVRSKAKTRFKRFNFNFDGYRYDTIQRGEGETPYIFANNQLWFKSRSMHRLPFSLLPPEEEEWGSERAWWFKSFPTLDPHYDLRLNPINTCSNLKARSGVNGEQRGCVFCHRCYDQTRTIENRALVSLDALFRDIEAKHGPTVFPKIKKVMVVTGDLDGEPAMLELLDRIYHDHLIPKGFVGVFSAVTTLIRSEQGIRRLANLDNTLFEFPIECFERRATILGDQKGISIEAVRTVLRIARKYFRSIRLNYLVGLDRLSEIRMGFEQLCRERLVDDVISNIFVPYDARALKYRLAESFDMRYLYGYREIMYKLGLSPKRTGPTKDAFSPFAKSCMDDELLPQKNRINVMEAAI